MCIRDSHYGHGKVEGFSAFFEVILLMVTCGYIIYEAVERIICLLYTSPSPRDGLLSIRRQRSDVYKRQPLRPRQSRGIFSLLRSHSPDGHVRLYHLRSRGENHLSLIHISEPTRRTPLYSSAAVRCV